jgi:hypothetical protein
MTGRCMGFAGLVRLAGIALLFSAGIAAAQEPTGRQILDESSKRHSRDYEAESQRMTLYSKGAVTETRELRRLTRKVGDGETRYLMTFTSPRGVRGVALLTWSFDKREDDQWLYLPAEGNRTKRIAKGGRRTAFMGTDYTYEDLVSESRDKFNYERKPDETIDGVAHFVVDATAADAELAKDTGYKSRRLFVRKDTYLIARIDYSDRRGELFKRQTMSNLVAVEGPVWRANTARMENLRDNTATVIEVGERQFADAAVPERMFVERYLTSQEHMR